MNNITQGIVEWYRKLLDHAADEVHVMGADGRIIDVSAYMCDALGYSREELLGMGVWDLDPDWTPERYIDVYETTPVGTILLIETNHRRKDGTLFPVEVRAVVTERDGSKVIASFARDITERRQTEASLKDQQVFLHRIIEAIPGRIFWKDRDLNYLGCNQRFAEDAGLASPEEIVGKTDFDLGWREQAELYRADDRRVIDTGEVKINYEEPQTTPNGSTIWLRTSKVPLIDADGNITGVLGTYDDITAQKQLDVERERLQQEVIEAQQRALRELSTPIIPVMEGIIVMPLVGSIDTMRAKDTMRTLMQGISAYRAKIVILDITGVPLVDSGVADHLNKTIQAARLKGTRTIVTGISDAVAETIVDLGIDWGGVETLRDLQTGLVVALESLGFRLSQS